MGASCSVEQQNFSGLLRDLFITLKENFHLILRAEEECFSSIYLFKAYILVSFRQGLIKQDKVLDSVLTEGTIHKEWLCHSCVSVHIVYMRCRKMLS